MIPLIILRGTVSAVEKAHGGRKYGRCGSRLTHLLRQEAGREKRGGPFTPWT